MARETHHALRSALIGLRGAGKTRPVPVVSSTTSIGSPAPPRDQSDASITNQTACVFLTPITFVVLQAFSSCCGSHSALPKKKNKDPQPRGEQAAASLPNHGVDAHTKARRPVQTKQVAVSIVGLFRSYSIHTLAIIGGRTRPGGMTFTATLGVGTAA